MNEVLPEGYLVSSFSAGIKKSKSPDLALIYSSYPCAAAGLFTTSRFKSAPVETSMERIVRPVRAVLVNAGCANAATGRQGMKDALTSARRTGSLLGIGSEEVLLASTGIIGKRLPMRRMLAGIEQCVRRLSREGWIKVARAIMTTDTKPKFVFSGCRVAGRYARIAAMAKGSGMISPSMATFICIIITDIGMSRALLQEALAEAAQTSFNAMAIDGDMSPNDTVFLLANNACGGHFIKDRKAHYRVFLNSLRDVCRHLAAEIVSDGEGATKTIRVRVKGCLTKDHARRIAKAVALSPLVKTAVYGEDPNWGRILAKAGSSGVPVDTGCMRIAINGYRVFKDGSAVTDRRYAKLRRSMKKRVIDIEMDICQGRYEDVFLTCDLSERYVRINAQYTT